MDIQRETKKLMRTSYVYLFVDKFSGHFKVGKSGNPLRRVADVVDIDLLDRNKSLVIAAPSERMAYFFEKTLHCLLEANGHVLERSLAHKVDGSTEWFDQLGFEGVAEWVSDNAEKFGLQRPESYSSHQDATEKAAAECSRLSNSCDERRLHRARKYFGITDPCDWIILVGDRALSNGDANLRKATSYRKWQYKATDDCCGSYLGDDIQGFLLNRMRDYSIRLSSSVAIFALHSEGAILLEVGCSSADERRLLSEIDLDITRKTSPLKPLEWKLGVTDTIAVSSVHAETANFIRAFIFILKNNNKKRRCQKIINQ